MLKPRNLPALLLAVFGNTNAQTWIVKSPKSSDHIYESEHFAIRFNDADKVVLSSSEITRGLQRFESYWDYYINELKFIEPYLGSATKYKFDVRIQHADYASVYRTSGNIPAMHINESALNEPETISHELVHCLQITSHGLTDFGYADWFYESHAEFMAGLYLKSTMYADAQVNLSHIYYGSTRDRYSNWLFFDYLKDQYGISSVNNLWTAKAPPPNSPAPAGDLFMVLNRTMGWSQERLNDEFGKYAMHNVTWDYTRNSLYQANFGKYTNRSREKRTSVTQLTPLDSAQRRFHVPSWWAPQRWGYNLVRLYPDVGATSVNVEFQGVIQNKAAITSFPKNANFQPSTPPQPTSGWRWGIVAVNADGTPRYSTLQSSTQGSLNIAIKPDDQSLWMIVLGAPTKHEPIFYDQVYYSIYRYPWMAQFTNAWPEGYQNGANNPPSGIAGARHQNGGGFVANTAKVAQTAWVGPYAKVLGKAQVQGNARIEDYAVVQGSAIVKDNAILSRHARAQDNSVISDSAQITDLAAAYDNASISGNAQVSALTVLTQGAKVSGNAKISAILGVIKTQVSGTAQLIGDLEVHKALSKGVFYGMVVDANDTWAGANRIAPVPEVTAAPTFIWSGPVAITSQGTLIATAVDIPKGIAQLTVSEIQGHTIDRIEFWHDNTLICTERLMPYVCRDTVTSSGKFEYQAKVYTSGATPMMWTLKGSTNFPYITNLQPYRTPNELYLNFNLPQDFLKSTPLTLQIISKANASNWRQSVNTGIAGTNRIKFGVKFSKRHTGAFNVRLLQDGRELGLKSITLF